MTALFSYRQVNRFSRSLADLKNELVKQHREGYENLDSKVEVVENNILRLKKEGYVEADDFSKISKRALESTVLVASDKDISKINFSGDTLVVDDPGLSGAGTGFFVRNDGYIVTAQHVINAISGEIMVLTSDGKRYKATIANTNDGSDLAIIKIDGNGDFPAVQLGYFDNIIPGDDIGFVGFSLSIGVVKPLIYRGNLSAKGVDKIGTKVFSINAFVNRGNSGGPVFSAKTGRVIGMLSARQRDVSSSQFIQLPAGYNSALMLGGIDPVKFNVDLYNETVKLVGDVSQVGIGLVYSLDGIGALLDK